MGLSESLDLNKIIDTFVELAMKNSEDTIEMWTDLTDMREIKELMGRDKSFREHINSVLYDFCLSNGLYYRLKFDELTDEQKTFISLITGRQYQPTNRYRQSILEYYYTHLNDKMTTLKLEDTGFCEDYYHGIPPIVIGMQKKNVINPFIPEISELCKRIDTFIKIGQSIQFDVEGFPKNQFLYLLCGLCIVDCISTQHSTFEELVNHIKAYVQLNLLSKCFDGRIFKDGYNLITFINFKRETGVIPNFRYQIANKYKPVQHDTITQLVEDEKGKYIKTECKCKDLEDRWALMEELYASKKFDELITVFFDSQCMTRSTCLIGCLLICILHKHCVSFKKDHMPDWKSIIEGNFDDTYEQGEEIITLFHDLTLAQVLSVLRYYAKRIC